MAQYTIISTQIDNPNLDANKKEIMDIISNNQYSLAEIVELFDSILKDFVNLPIT